MSSIKRFILIITLTMMWSPSFLFIKYAVVELPPITVVTLRVSLAALIFLGILGWKRRSIPLNAVFWFRMTMMAFLSSIFPFALFCYAEQTIESALAAILNGSTPLFTAILAHSFVPSDKITFPKALGIGLGAGGLLVLFAPNILQGLVGSTLGMVAGTAAAISYSVSHVYGKKFTTGQLPYVAPAAQFIISSLLLWPFAIYYEGFFNLPVPSLTAMGGVLGLALLGTVAAFIIYYKLLDHCGPTAISMVACFFPVGGMLLGFIFLGETFTSLGFVGAGMILFGMLIVNEVISLPFLKPVKSPMDHANI